MFSVVRIPGKLGTPHSEHVRCHDIGGSVRFSALVLEPDSDARRQLVAALREHGADADVVDEPSAVYWHTSARRYDLICADLSLTDAQFLSIDEVLDRSGEAATLILTGIAEGFQRRARAVGRGGMAFLARPYCDAQLRWLISKAMAHAHRARSPEPPRTLMYSHDTIGLGHMRRNSNIAREIVRSLPESSVLMLVGCPAGQIFDMPAGVDHVKLPSLLKLSRTEWRPDRLNISAERARVLRCRLIREAVESFEPDVILIDHMPLGVWNELAGILGELRRSPRCPEIMLGLRDILDAPEATRSAWQASGADRAIAELFDEVLVYGEPRIFDTIGAYGLEDLAPGRVGYTGYVVAERSGMPETANRRRSGSGDRPGILIAGGGGRDAYPLIATALGGLAGLPKTRRPEVTVVAGPLMPQDLRARLTLDAAALGADYYDHVTDFPERLAACDFLLGMAGYNSMVEAASAGICSLVVPRTGPSSEQMTRARVFASHGIAEMLLPEAAEPAALGARLAEVSRTEPRTPRLAADGARSAAARIVQRIQARYGVVPLKAAAS